MLLKNMGYMLYYNSWKGAASGRLPDKGRQVFSLKKPDGKPAKMPSEHSFRRHFCGFAGSAEDQSKSGQDCPLPAAESVPPSLSVTMQVSPSLVAGSGTA